MSEEMNLYKRCKNIFKNHGVDMGGGESVPVAPSDDGTYKLTCTVTDGEPVYSWESVSESGN